MDENMESSLSLPQFEVLYEISKADSALSCEDLEKLTSLSSDTVSVAMQELAQLGYTSENMVTDDGISALEPYRVKNAVIMAAGLSSRFAPISYERPKGTLRVRGEILMERQIDQLLEAGITDITLIVGYKKEYYFYLKEKYDIDIIVNKEYSTRNNNGSLWLVKEKLDNTYICSSDNYFTENPFRSHEYHTYYAAQYAYGETDEWCIDYDEDGLIVGAVEGGADSWIMMGHAYFDSTFTQNFRDVLHRVYHLPHTAGKLWDVVYLDHINELDMWIKKYPDNTILEFDSVDELREFDPDFMQNVDSEIFDNISSALHCEKSKIHDFYPLKQGLTNLSCHFSVGNNEYVYRHPGIGTEKIIDRNAELTALAQARELGFDSTFVVGDAAKGWKISRFIPNARTLDASNDDELKTAMEIAHRLHNSSMVLDKHFDYVEEGLRFSKLNEQIAPIEVPGYYTLQNKIIELKKFADADGYPTVPSHNDFFQLNFLIEEDGSMNLIDWEYAGISDAAADFGTLVVHDENMTDERADEALTYYFGREPSAKERRHFWAYVTFSGWFWYVWALLKEAEGDELGEWLLTYYTYATKYVDSLLQDYKNSSK
ncbi:phosphotransferase [Arcanobacterium phocae]|uniref:phosphotransferase n=1 Tax=Arcanobacterium phocae TaxID=131112 RepID=UPI0020A1ECCB|nr:phosphotransferase [Arcanobacterium phocae]